MFAQKTKDRDEAKRRLNCEMHGLGFADLAAFDWVPAVVAEAVRRALGL